MNCVLTCGVAAAAGVCCRLGIGRLDLVARAGLRFDGDGGGGGGDRVPLPAWPCAAWAALCARLATRAAERRGIDGAIGHGHDGADLGQVGVVEHEGLVLGGDAVENAVGLGAGEQAALRIDARGR